jgi:hypothetical protein
MDGRAWDFTREIPRDEVREGDFLMTGVENVNVVWERLGSA